MKKLVLFGDSLFGQFGKHCIAALEASLPGYDVYNCAAGGWDTNDCLKKAPYIAGLRPDLVIISLGTNDMSPWKQVELPQFIENLNKIMRIFSTSQVIYFLPPPVNEASEPDDKKIENETAKQYHDAAKALCEDLNIAYVDSWKVFMPLLEAGRDYHVEDGVHLSDRGYEILIGELVALVK